MQESRRSFLHGSAALGACALFPAASLLSQQPHRGMPDPPQAAGPSETEQPVTRPKIDPRAIMQQHEKDFRDSLNELYEKVRELKAQADNTPTSEIFSVKIYDETKEIEKLAKQLRNRAKN